MLWVVVLVLLSAERVSAWTNCTSKGEWGEWKDWQSCAIRNNQKYSIIRYRDCDPLPLGCNATYTFSCSGDFSQTESCTLDDSDTSTSTTASTTTSVSSTTSASSSSSSTASSSSSSSSSSTSTATTTTAAATLPNTNNQATCSWSSWGEYSTCTDTCGMCGQQQRFRSCSSTSCTCSGSSMDVQTCASSVCLYPRSSCCPGYGSSSNGTTFICKSTSA